MHHCIISQLTSHSAACSQEPLGYGSQNTVVFATQIEKLQDENMNKLLKGLSLLLCVFFVVLFI